MSLLPTRTFAGLDIPNIMDNWVSKVCHCTTTVVTPLYSHCEQMGFPVLTVTETPTGIRVRQDRFLEHGRANPEENETIW